jgi:cobalt/nickel transport system permease protein
VLYIDQYVYQNKLRFSHPLEKTVFAGVNLLCCVATDKPLVHLVVVAGMLGLLAIVAKIPVFVLSRLMFAPAAFLLLGGLAIAVNVGTSPDGMTGALQLGPLFLGVSRQSLSLAAVTVTKSLGATSALYFLVLTTPLSELLYVLRKLRVPAVVIELMMLVYRFIFVFLETAFAMYNAQSARLGFISFKRSLHSFGLLFANLWVKAFFRSQALYNGLLSRGYDGNLAVLHPEFKFSPAVTAAFTLLASGVIILAFIA